MEKGFVQIYTGNGKGKTTAAMGLALRAAGRGLSVYIGQFMKGTAYGEAMAMAQIPSITITQYGDSDCLIRREDVTKKDRDNASKGLEAAWKAMVSGSFDLVILDEINVTLWFGLLPLEDLLRMIRQKPEGVELVLTGRYAPRKLLDAADLVTEMREVKHYYTRDVLSRDGIER